MQNSQRPEPFDASTGGILDFHTMWHTIQGEGPFTGTPAFFIRLAGCNLQCPWCDTEYTQGRIRIPVSKLVGKLLELAAEHKNTGLVVITGGEPTRQHIDPLIFELLGFKYHVQIESNGVLAPSLNFLQWTEMNKVSYVVSPKTKRICDATRHATAFKYVIDHTSLNPEDGLPLQALGHAARPMIARPPAGYPGPVYVSPMDAGNQQANRANLIACRDSSLKHGYICGVQLHKILDVA